MQQIDHQLAERLPLRILVVEDNPINQQVSTKILSRMGYSPSVANNGIEALAAVQQGTYDLIFMDLQMPEMDGLEATRRIRQREAERPDWADRASLIIVALTTHTTPADRERCTVAGMDDFLAKPLEVDSLQATIEKWGSVVHKAPLPATSVGATPKLASPEKPPVEVKRIHEFAEGDGEAFRSLVQLYLQQTTEQLAQMQAAIQAGQSRELEHLAHSCAGASATCGMNAIVPALRTLEQMGREGRWEGASDLQAEAVRQFDRMRQFLEIYQKSVLR